MQLVRGNITKASEIMLPLYPTLVIPIGLAFIFQNPSRTSGPVYELAKTVMPMHGWGFIFLVVGLLEVLAMVLGQLDVKRNVSKNRSRRLYEWALIVGAGLCAFWMVLILATSFQSELVSYTAGWWLMIAVGAHVASARSLGEGERQ